VTPKQCEDIENPNLNKNRRTANGADSDTVQ